MRPTYEVAHVLERVATPLASTHTFVDGPPCIYDLICNEML